MNLKNWIATGIAIAAAGLVNAQNTHEARLLRFPAVHGQQVVFSYAGDLYTVARSGGEAHKITNDPGYEMFPKFSHDGSRIAFTGQYDGNTEVYFIPSQGGVPKRLTYTATLRRDDISDRMGPNNIVMGWAPDDQSVIYRSRRYTFNAFKGQLFKAPLSGDLSEEMPFSVAGWCSYNTDGSKLAYNRIFREFRTWKYYRGGMADDIWVYDTQTHKTENISNNDAQDVMPMYWKNKVYYLSDRDRIMNLFVYDTETGTTEKVTSFTEYDIKFPSLCKDAIAFENGGYLYIYDLNTQKQEKITVTINGDFQATRSMQADASEHVYGHDISPDGKRIVLAGRGDIFTLPANSGVTRNLTHSSNANDRSPAWSPDGKWIAFVSDKSGEDEVYVQAQDGSSPARAVTSGGGAYKYHLVWSPDCKFIAYNDRSMRLWLVHVATSKKEEIAKSKDWEIVDFAFSPDSKRITYTEPNNTGQSILRLYHIENRKTNALTKGFYEIHSPCFSSDGQYVFFISSRDFNARYDGIDKNYFYRDSERIYAVRLNKKAAVLFPVENDETAAGEAAKEEPETENTTVFEADGIFDRLEQFPVSAGYYRALSPVKGGIYYYFVSMESSGKMKFFDLKEKKEETMGAYPYFTFSASGENVMIEKDGEYFIEPAPEGRLELKNKVSLSGMKMRVNTSEEWAQIYHESWRQMRDFFYDPAMHGTDWEAMRTKYGVLLPYVKHRNDLNYIIGELIGELNVGHAYVSGGDRPNTERIRLGLLGARYSRHKNGFYKIEHIPGGASWNPDLKSPLQADGVFVHVGEYIISINGRSTADMGHLSQALIGKAGQYVEIEVNEVPSTKGARKIIVKPIGDESQLYYYEWVENNLKKVDELSEGTIGYVHIPDMVTTGLNQFARYFYAQTDKRAMLIDVRSNGGGNVSSIIIERLRREPGFIGVARGSEAGVATPNPMVVGPKACLIDMYSASDGDLFSYQFRHYGIGKLIGTRSWGGVVGIRGSLPFIDGGTLHKPEFAHYSTDGSKWIIEGHGVEPDIKVPLDPYEEYHGNDVQLKKAVEHLLGEIEKQNKTVPGPPDFPKKN